jgi:hypothetical protein
MGILLYRDVVAFSSGPAQPITQSVLGSHRYSQRTGSATIFYLSFDLILGRKNLSTASKHTIFIASLQAL